MHRVHSSPVFETRKLSHKYLGAASCEFETFWVDFGLLYKLRIRIHRSTIDRSETLFTSPYRPRTPHSGVLGLYRLITLWASSRFTPSRDCLSRVTKWPLGRGWVKISSRHNGPGKSESFRGSFLQWLHGRVASKVSYFRLGSGIDSNAFAFHQLNCRMTLFYISH